MTRDQAMSDALREALTKPWDHEKIAAEVWKVAISDLPLSIEQRGYLSQAVDIVRATPACSPPLVKREDGTIVSRYLNEEPKAP